VIGLVIYNAKVGACIDQAERAKGRERGTRTDALENAALISIHYPIHPSSVTPRRTRARPLPSYYQLNCDEAGRHAEAGHCGRQLAPQTIAD
jgi:hypothetical protein